ncbi:hypothetical protein TKK_0011726 [Trichogramma kaykai]|uniref:Uncharacterized protein n=1 Tax=Trichogramma kaykai TaxID=54128 RepID=A0ABD2WPJ9_9HYME
MIGALLLILWIFCASGARLVQCHDGEEDQSDYPAVDYTDYVLSTTESSSSYLRNVVSELQRFHGIEPKTKPPPRRRPPMVMTPVTTARPIFRQPPTRLEPQPSQQQIIQQKRPMATPQQNPSVLGFTPAQLATMYRTALEQGSPLRYDDLVTSINRYLPKILGLDGNEINQNSVEPPMTAAAANLPYHLTPPQVDQKYAYYFYPLDTFRHELVDSHGYRTLPPARPYDFYGNRHYGDLVPAESIRLPMTAAATTATSSTNPIIVGLSSFLGMALFFIVSLFVYPRFIHFFNFPLVATRGLTRQSHAAQSSLVARLVWEALDSYNRANVSLSKKNNSAFRGTRTATTTMKSEIRRRSRR